MDPGCRSADVSASIRNNGVPVNTFWYTPPLPAVMPSPYVAVGPVLRLTNGTADWMVQAWTTDASDPGLSP